MSETRMNTREVAEYSMSPINKVYAIVKSRLIPATRINGKRLFPRNLIDEHARSGFVEPRQRNRNTVLDQNTFLKSRCRPLWRFSMTRLSVRGSWE
jgi:hypothetical protein